MDYRFKPISKTCAATNQPLEPGTQCYSALIEQDGVFERRDYSPEGWDGLPENAVGYWMAQVPIPEQKEAATADPEALFQYFEQLTDNANPQQEKLRYVLALYLLQRRRLHLECSVTIDDVEHLQVIGSRGEGPYEIPNQNLPEDELKELQAALNHQLTAEWNAA